MRVRLALNGARASKCMCVHLAMGTVHVSVPSTYSRAQFVPVDLQDMKIK
jgi:hypothetical protein